MTDEDILNDPNLSDNEKIETIYRNKMNAMELRLGELGCETIAFMLSGSRMFTRQVLFKMNDNENVFTFGIAQCSKLADLELEYFNSLANFLEEYRKQGVTDVRTDSSNGAEHTG